ncbi:MAG: nucleotidyltransferase family protein [Oscillospiraceae bacterium]|jgi:CTP:molybdopterin cytidylyltransferase MocA|nr:nucleotidyltransferase family protein [Oscillospiraceae bacterium]
MCAKKCVTVVPAAGFSSRMKDFKPLIDIGGLPLFIRTAGAALSGSDAAVLVTGHRAGDIERAAEAHFSEQIRRGRLLLAHNSDYAEGMLTSMKAGIAAALEEFSPDGIFLLPADCCCVPGEVFAAIKAEFTGKSVLYPTFCGQRGHPPLIPAAFLAELGEYSGQDGLRGYLAQFPGAEVAVEEEGILLDADTQEDLAHIRRRF